MLKKFLWTFLVTWIVLVNFSVNCSGSATSDEGKPGGETLGPTQVVMNPMRLSNNEVGVECGAPPTAKQGSSFCLCVSSCDPEREDSMWWGCVKDEVLPDQARSDACCCPWWVPCHCGYDTGNHPATYRRAVGQHGEWLDHFVSVPARVVPLTYPTLPKWQGYRNAGQACCDVLACCSILTLCCWRTVVDRAFIRQKRCCGEK